ncbi:hypothetical protein JW887_03005 [Candidatus Dojkabacteria bacterium]|nr:hypothetical protein [Candidatus Dojkabacteria bacterium]
MNRKNRILFGGLLGATGIVACIIVSLVLVILILSNIKTVKKDELQKDDTSDESGDDDVSESSDSGDGQSEDDKNTGSDRDVSFESQLSNDTFDITIKNFDIDVSDGQVNAMENQDPDFVPVVVNFASNGDILFLSDEQNVLADISDPYLNSLIEQGTSMVDDSSALYDFSKQNFSALNIEDFNYDEKMAKSSEQDPVKLSDLAESKAGYCLEQSIFRALVYAYAGKPMNLAIMFPSRDNASDFGHATVKDVSSTPDVVVKDFLDTGLYSWEVRYYEEILIEMK